MPENTDRILVAMVDNEAKSRFFENAGNLPLVGEVVKGSPKDREVLLQFPDGLIKWLESRHLIFNYWEGK